MSIRWGSAQVGVVVLTVVVSAALAPVNRATAAESSPEPLEVARESTPAGVVAPQPHVQVVDGSGAPLQGSATIDPDPDRVVHVQRVEGSDEPLRLGDDAPAVARSAVEAAPGAGQEGALLLAPPSLFSIPVSPAPGQPVAVDDSYAVASDAVLSVAAPGFLGNDVDLDGEAITAVLVSATVSNGSLSAFPNGSFTYTPNAGFVGTDSFTYRMRDASSNYDEATVTIHVIVANRPPDASDDTFAATEDVTLVVAPPGVLGNDSDPDGNALSVIANTAPANGTLAQAPDGGLTYTPAANYCGTDSYTYTVADPLGESDTATVTIEVACVNDPPVAADDAYTTAENQVLVVAAPGVLANDSDVDGDALLVHSFDAASSFGGVVNVVADGSLTYSPPAGFAGFDTFTYTITDGNGTFATATVTVVVEAIFNRSIDVTLENWTRSGTIMGGQIGIINKSGRGLSVQVVDLVVMAEYRVPGARTWTPAPLVAGSCGFTPPAPFVVTHRATVAVAGCRLAAPPPEQATIRVIGAVRIAGRIAGNGHADGWFTAKWTL